jgi:hypothetical protein
VIRARVLATLVLAASGSLNLKFREAFSCRSAKSVASLRELLQQSQFFGFTSRLSQAANQQQVGHFVFRLDAKHGAKMWNRFFEAALLRKNVRQTHVRRAGASFGSRAIAASLATALGFSQDAIILTSCAIQKENAITPAKTRNQASGKCMPATSPQHEARDTHCGQKVRNPAVHHERLLCLCSPLRCRCKTIPIRQCNQT